MRPRFAFLVLTVLCAGLFGLSVCTGALGFSLQNLDGAAHSGIKMLTVILVFRLPRALTALAGGAGLGVAGALMQTLFCNPLAGPDVLGISSGASLGIALLLLAAGDLEIVGTFIEQLQFMGTNGLIIAAVSGAAAVMVLIQLVALRVHRSVTLLVLGMMIGYAVSSAVSVMISLAMPMQTQAFLSWSFGSFSGTELENALLLCGLCLTSVAGAACLSKGFDALYLGENAAVALGVNVKVLRYAVILLTSLTAGIVTAFCGPVSFLGIAVPHVSRILCPTMNHRVQLPLVALTGGCMALAADLLSRWGGALPLNSVTSLMGVPVVIWVVLSGQSRR